MKISMGDAIRALCILDCALLAGFGIPTLGAMNVASFTSPERPAETFMDESIAAYQKRLPARMRDDTLLTAVRREGREIVFGIEIIRGTLTADHDALRAGIADYACASGMRAALARKLTFRYDYSDHHGHVASIAVTSCDGRPAPRPEAPPLVSSLR